MSHDRLIDIEASNSSQVSKDKSKAPAIKRRKQNKATSIEDLEVYLNDLRAQAGASYMTTNNTQQGTWEEQHHAMLARRREEHEEMLQLRARELDEVYDRRRKELETDKEALAFRERQDMARIMVREERLAADIARHAEKIEAFQTKVEAFHNKVEAFQNERVKLVGENQRLASKLETYDVNLLYKRAR